MERYQATHSEETAELAAYYGVSQQNFFSSLSPIGKIGFEVGQAGLAITGANPRNALLPQTLFTGVYAESEDREYASPPSSDIQKTEHVFPDEINEYSLERNISPLVIVRVGIKILYYAMNEHAGPNADLNVHQVKLGGKIGKLDSKISFSISPINTIIAARRKVGLFEKPSR